MSDAPGPREALERLIEHFDQNLYALKSPQYNEAQVRQEFINPFFTLLGWDMDNRQGYAEAYKDVIHEDAIKVGGYTKAPDYCFRIGGTRKFFVEAKKPSVHLKDDPEPAYQLRRYAWSAKLPLSILTDFQEFAVYDCRMKPSPSDKASTGRIQYITYGDYAKEWESLASVFSREAVLKGSFDTYAESNKAKRGTTEVDKAFLLEIEAWRDALARNLALRNPNLTTRELNFAVQATIDRIIFLRICEDRGVEDYARLMALQNGPDVYPRLMGLFRAADERYNSGLFHFESEKGREVHDTLTPNLTIDDKVLKDLLKGLYYPDSPYEFSVLPADILGQVYEQFLGKVIRLTAGHQAKVEDKPEVKKAGGVYYTPTYIVDYIVKNTVGKMLEGKTPAQASGESRRGGAPSPPVVGPARGTGGHGGPPLRILDPACGSGSFLLGAYQYLLTWYRDRYVEEGPEKWAKGKEPRLYQASGGEWKLTTSERKRILLNHIYGVDIDAQAVEVTKLSLLLKVLEGETKESVSIQRRLFHERALPDLSRNIKCGNSLIGSDFYTGKQDGLFEDEDERDRINAFDWDVEFPEVFGKLGSRGEGQGPRVKGQGSRENQKATTLNPNPSTLDPASRGFDVVIGNPPYIRIQTLKEWAPEEVEHYKEAYESASKGNYDIYVVFVERGLSLLNQRGRLGFILPHKFFNAKYGEPLRGVLSRGHHLAEVIHFGDQQVFDGATTYTALLFLERQGTKECRVVKVNDLDEWRIMQSAPRAVGGDTYPREFENTDHGASREGQDMYPGLRKNGTVQGFIPASAIMPSEWNFSVGAGAALFEKLSQMPVKLGDISSIFVGLQTSADTVFLFKQARPAPGGLALVYSKELESDVYVESALLKPVVRSGDIGRYYANPKAWVLFPYKKCGGKFQLYAEEDMAKQFPKAWSYLKENKPLLSAREHGKFRDAGWHQLYPKNLDSWEQTKIMLPYMITRLAAYLDYQDLYFVNVTTGGFGLTVDQSFSLPQFLLGLLNSKLLDWYMKEVSSAFHGGYFAANKQFLVQLPIRRLILSTPSDKSRHDELVALVNRMLGLLNRLPLANTDHDKTLIQRQIAATDKEIDRLVYGLYGLTDDEIAIVEGSP